MANKAKDVFAAAEPTDDGPRIEYSQPSSDAPHHVTHEAVVAHASSPPRRSPKPIEKKESRCGLRKIIRGMRVQ